MWNPSGARSAFGHHSCTHESIHRAPSPATTLMEARCSGVNVLEEQAEHVPAVPVVRLYRPMPFVVDDHGDARVAFAVAGLVHADRREAAERRRHRRFQPFGDPMGGVFRRRATRRAENRLRSSGSRRSSATRVPIRNRVWTGCPARPTARKRPRRRTPPPWSCPRRLLPHREHRSIPARGRTRISSTGSERGGESVIRASSATAPLTFGNPANELLLRRSS